MLFDMHFCSKTAVLCRSSSVPKPPDSKLQRKHKHTHSIAHTVEYKRPKTKNTKIDRKSNIDPRAFMNIFGLEHIWTM